MPGNGYNLLYLHGKKGSGKTHLVQAMAHEFQKKDLKLLNAHNALEDAKTCGTITCMAAKKQGSGCLEELLAAAGIGMGIM